MTYSAKQQTAIRVLVVEDDPFQQRLMKSLLSSMDGVQCEVADNGLRAVAQLSQQPEPDFIFCDLHMPEMDGVEFIRSLAKRSLGSHLVLSSSAEDDVVTAVKSMASGYGLKDLSVLSKPVRKQQLQALMDDLLAKPKAKITASLKHSLKPCFSDQQLQQALYDGEFQAYYQPHIDAKTGMLVGAEALVRWQHQGQLYMPNAFLSRLLELGQGHQLTKQVLTQAVASCAKWQNELDQAYVSVNVTPSDLMDLRFADFVAKLLEQHQLPAHRLVLEVTENEIYPQMAKALDSLSRLRLLGVGLAVDDFGTGHSSMMQLCTSPFTELKIDQLFIRRMLSDRKCAAVVRASLALAESLGIRSVAEGVEDQQLADTLEEWGCDGLQGYCYAKAMALPDFITWAKAEAQLAKDIAGA
ncbi:EAL domain-containing response regulator [Agarivorans litoreus]|uniref:EAL domain-containing response regulator n=1 Tax=Agarivorans litoreus TaxID=1510455 RepID=UPI001C7DBF28|nr:EAL domain-containing protein [Agarivorans litoreus]